MVHAITASELVWSRWDDLPHHYWAANCGTAAEI